MDRVGGVRQLSTWTTTAEISAIEPYSTERVVNAPRASLICTCPGPCTLGVRLREPALGAEGRRAGVPDVRETVAGAAEEVIE
jgi:hypothetical protein